MLIRRVGTLLAVLAFVSAAAAPAITVSPNPLSAGGTATVTFSGGTPNSTVRVSINDGTSPPDTKTDAVDVRLDGNGEGQATWPVPASGWSFAIFTAPGANPVGVVITGTGGPG